MTNCCNRHIDIPIVEAQKDSFKNVEIISDNFEKLDSNWLGVDLGGGGSFYSNNEKLTVIANTGSTYAVVNTKKISGHFYAEIDFLMDDCTALALFNAKSDGSVDTNNYCMISVMSENGNHVLTVKDRQNGKDNVLDNTFQRDKEKRYKNELGKNDYSVPWSSTAKRLRILRHDGEKFFHFYYQVSKTVNGITAIGWAELAPSKEWSQLTGEFYVGVVAINGTAVFDNLSVWTKPLSDKTDENTGFKATLREFTWSGYSGEALVVTFDKINAPLTEGKRKFIFWKETNYVPCWYLDENILYTNEFVETWNGGYKGCHEPMSDRLLLFSKINLIEDNDTRKVIHWHYVLSNPDYHYPTDGVGTQMPEVDEYYYIYPDATIIRKIRYKPKLDSDFRSWHELTELIVINGNSTKAVDHLSNPALSIWPINSTEEKYYPSGGSNYDMPKNDATILAAHFNKHPDIFNVFCDLLAYPQTNPGYPINIYKNWHSVKYGFTHWPISKEQYWTSDPNSNPQMWSQQVNHSSLAGAGVYGGTDWNSNYKIDSDGRKYREFLSLMSMSPKGDLQTAKQTVQKWLKDPLNWIP